MPTRWTARTGFRLVALAWIKHPDFADIPCTEDMDTCQHLGVRSQQHNEGVNAAMGDGSVQFVADDIDACVACDVYSRGRANP